MRVRVRVQCVRVVCAAVGGVEVGGGVGGGWVVAGGCVSVMGSSVVRWDAVVRSKTCSRLVVDCIVESQQKRNSRNIPKFKSKNLC